MTKIRFTWESIVGGLVGGVIIAILGHLLAFGLSNLSGLLYEYYHNLPQQEWTSSEGAFVNFMYSVGEGISITILWGLFLKRISRVLRASHLLAFLLVFILTVFTMPAYDLLLGDEYVLMAQLWILLAISITTCFCWLCPSFPPANTERDKTQA
jgi:hypothetical protein